MVILFLWTDSFVDFHCGLAMSTAQNKKAKPTKLREGVDEIVLQWFKNNNRPATTQGIVDALGSRVTKATCQKSLDSLVEQHSLLVKEIKKAKYYYLDQSKILEERSEQEVNEEVTPSQSERLSDLRSTLHKSAQRLAVLEEEKRRAETSRLRVDGANQLQCSREKLKTQRERLFALSSGAEANVDWTSLTEQYTLLRSLWRDRRQACQEIMDALLDCISLEDLLQASGVVTDKELGVAFESTAVNFKKRPRA